MLRHYIQELNAAGVLHNLAEANRRKMDKLANLFEDLVEQYPAAACCARLESKADEKLGQGRAARCDPPAHPHCRG